MIEVSSSSPKKYLVNENRMGSKQFFQYLSIVTGRAGKPELLRISGKVGGSKREVRKRYSSVLSARKDYDELLKHFLACGYEEKNTPEVFFN